VMAIAARHKPHKISKHFSKLKRSIRSPLALLVLQLQG
jgi:hypothetical protein